MTKWSVIACDQFSSERGYWERIKETVGAAPSTLKLIVPEAYLGEVDTARSAADIAAKMGEYLQAGLLKPYGNSFIYVERTISDGRVRRGLIGCLDLELYDYTPGAAAPVRASENTIVSRLPARVDVRRLAPLELPHIMALIDDSKCRVIEPLGKKTDALEKVYDFALMEGGGSIRGWRVTGDDIREVEEGLRCLGEKSAVQIIIGDGNHSLAAAKTYWDEIKSGFGEEERRTHPARFALVELNNVYDPAISFEAIHRVVFNTEPEALLMKLKKALPIAAGEGYQLRWSTAEGQGTIQVDAPGIGRLIELLQTFLDVYANGTGCEIDYIHGDDSVLSLTKEKGSIGFLLPAIDKSDFFKTVADGGVYPKKSFSIGHARDKRYYLECRAIK
ncbi:MAG: DUF1015 domain-containing protein [Clostridiales bacterium]|nr:DUF1015 domain-containing protein [Clostridiales bacterium]